MLSYGLLPRFVSRVRCISKTLYACGNILKKTVLIRLALLSSIDFITHCSLHGNAVQPVVLHSICSLDCVHFMA